MSICPPVREELTRLLSRPRPAWWVGATSRAPVVPHGRPLPR